MKFANKNLKILYSLIPKSALILASGTLLSAVFTIILTPVLAQTYSAKEFGEYVLYTSGVNIISQLVCFKFEYQITASKDKIEASALIMLSSIVAVFVTGLVVAVAFINNQNRIILIAVGSFFAGINTMLINSSIYFGKIKVAAIGAGLKGILLPTIQIVISSFPYGLLWGNVIAIFLVDSFIFGSIVKNISPIKISQVAMCAKKYKAYPTYMLAGSVSAALMANQQAYFIDNIDGGETAGYYSMSQRILSLPVSIISSAISQIIIKKSALEYRKDGRISIIGNYQKKLWLLSMIVFGGIFFLAGLVTDVFLGRGWENSVLLIRIMAPLFAIRMVVVPLTALMPTIGRQKDTMLWQFMMLGSSFASAFLAEKFSLGSVLYLIINSSMLSVGYLGFYFYTLFCIKKLNKVEKTEE